jgi:putative ubiquitin-RnfH superfamily antitoxin RatB of RatAB toxin-antitoxin module
VGIFGKFTKLEASVKAGDRVEIYRPITADPKTTPRRKTADDDDDD